MSAPDGAHLPAKIHREVSNPVAFAVGAAVVAAGAALAVASAAVGTHPRRDQNCGGLCFIERRSLHNEIAPGVATKAAFATGVPTLVVGAQRKKDGPRGEALRLQAPTSARLAAPIGRF